MELGFIDGVQPKKRKRIEEEDNSIFSELITTPRLEEKHEELLTKIGDTFHDQVSHIPTRKEILFSSKDKARIFLHSLSFPKITIRGVFIVLLIGILIVISLIKVQSVKADTNALSEEAQNHIENAFTKIDNGDLSGSLEEANLAKEKIQEMKMMAQKYGQDVQYFRYTPYKNSKLAADERLLDATYTIIETMTGINNVFSQSSGDEGGYTGKGSKYIFNIEQSGKSISEFLVSSKTKLASSKNDLDKIKGSLDSEKQQKIEMASNTIEKSLVSIDFFDQLVSKDLPWLSGQNGEKRKILVLFQNNAELRGGSGGSLGSFGIANFADGKLTNIDFGKNIYKIDKPFATKNPIEPPEIIKFLTPNWVMKDSGWAVDGADASKNIIDFYAKETGEKVDGVAMIDTTAIVSLLKIFGPIEMKDFQKTITAENFRTELENEVHDTYFDKPENLIENEPKKIIGAMMPIFIEKILDSFQSDNVAKVLASFSQSLKSKDITFYFIDKDFQNNIEKLNYGGNILPSIGDYLYINNSNIGGQKSSLSIEEKINLNVKIDSSGSISNTLNIKRKHNGKNELPDGINKNFVRLLLPENAKIQNFTTVSGNFEQMWDKGLKDGSPYWLEKDSGKSVVNFWMSTEPGNESELTLIYEPNVTVNTAGDFTYIFTAQKQPGANPDDLKININYPSGFTPINVKNYDAKNHKISLSYYLDQDKTFKIRFKKE